MLSANELEAIPEGIMRMFRELELATMSDIVERISYNLEITSLTDWQINRVYQLGVGKKVIKRNVQRTLGLTSESIDKIYKNTLTEEYVRFKPVYQKLGESFIPYKQNKPLQQLVKGVKAQTKGELKNITQSMGFSVKSATGKREFLPIADYYQKTLDKAATQILTGTADYNTVLKKTVREMTNSGLRTVDYASGWTNRVDVAARRAVLTGYRQVVGEINKENAEKLDTDLYEVSFHAGARPSHQEWEGGVYTMDELIDICGYGEVDGLMGANCYHDITPFIEGVSVRTYTDEELEKMKAEENEPKEFNGKEYNAYEAQQRQRALETNLRAKREEIALLEKGGASAEDIDAAKAKYRAVSDEYSKFSKSMGIPQQRDRINISPHDGVDVSFGS